MNSHDARLILEARRPGERDTSDPSVVEAMRQLDHDSELARWFTELRSFDAAISEAIQGIPVPRALKASILDSRKIVELPLWLNWRARIALAASLLFIGVVARVYIAQGPATFADFRKQLIDQSWDDAAHLSMTSSDLQKVQQWLVEHDVTADFTLPAPMRDLSLRGCRIIHWNGHKTSLICFAEGPRHVHLFIVDQLNFPDLPSAGTLDFERCSGWKTASWRQGGQIYILSGMNNLTFVKKFRKSGQWLMTS